MRKRGCVRLLSLTTSLAAFWLPGAPANAADAIADKAQGGDTAPQSAIAEIIVTAQKRVQAINNVGMAISAFTGPSLTSRGITTTSDLNKVVAGLSVQPSGSGVTGAPVYTLRGVGFNEKSASALSAVSFSDDDMPLPYVWMTSGPSLDLQRVEVLKGPQGTLYGQNSTGGAINFISNKPTENFAAGGEISYGSYDRVDASGFVSGPLGDTLKARIALRSITADGWQKSISRPGDRLGSKDAQAGRIIVDWAAGSGVRLELNLNGFRDRSESQAPQEIGINPAVPCQIFLPGCPPLSQASYPAFNAIFAPGATHAPSNPRKADWLPGINYRNNNYFGQAGLRLDWELNSDITLTAIGSGSYLHYRTLDDATSTSRAFIYGAGGTIHAYNEEVRINGSSFDKRLHWIVGGNLSQDKINDNQYSPAPEATFLYIFGISGAHLLNDEVRKTQSVFASGDFDLTSDLTLTGGVRYSRNRLRSTACAADNGDGALAAVVAGGLTAPGQCVTFLNETGPDLGAANPFALASNYGAVHKRLNENSVSWRVGLNWKPIEHTLLYATVSRGYKGGNFPTISGTAENQYDPVVQEKVTTYEAGFKSRFFDGALQFDGAVFHSDYINKQIYAFINLPIAGTNEDTVNVPKSKVTGAEFEATLRPFAPLTLQANVSYIATKVTKGPVCEPSNPISPTCVYAAYSYPSYPGGPPNALLDLKGERFELAPKWQANIDAEYRDSLSSTLDGFVGGSVVYQSSESPTIGASTGQIVTGLATIDQTLPAYTTLDVRIGVAMKNGAWRAMLWGRNVTNKLYVVNVGRGFDTTFRYTGMPATFGATLSFDIR